MIKNILQRFLFLNKFSEITKFIFKPVFAYILYAVFIFLSFQSPIGIMLLLGFAFLNVLETVKIVFADPEDINYKRKTDKELYAFLFQSCITAFFFALITFQILIYIALLFWFYFIFFMLKFSGIWKFHGKKRIYFFAVLIAAVVLSFIAAPFVREGISVVFKFSGIN